MWSQVDIFEMCIGDGNDLTDEDLAAADAAVDKLFSVFYDNPKLAKAVRNAAKKYDAAGMADKAMELRRTNVEDSPNNVAAMLSQMDIIYSCIDSNDVNDAAVDAEVDKLLHTFADQPTLPRRVYYIGNHYRKKDKYNRAIHFYQLVGEKWPKDDFALTSRVEIGKIHIQLGEDEAVTAVIDKMITDFNDHTRLPVAVFKIGEEYYYKAADGGADLNSKAEAKDYYRKAKGVWERIITESANTNAEVTKDAYYFIAVCLRRTGRYEEAIAYYQTVVDNWPNYKYAWSAQCLIGECFERLQESGVLPEAEAEPIIELAYKQVIENYPECSLAGHACLKLAEMELKKGRNLEAAVYYELFLTLAPSDPRVKSVKARLESLGGQSK